MNLFTFSDLQSFETKVSMFNKKLIEHIKEPNSLGKLASSYDNVVCVYIYDANYPVTISYKEMKTGGIRVTMETSISKYTIGEYKGKISFNSVLKKIYAMANGQSPTAKTESTSTPKTKKTKKESSSNKSIDLSSFNVENRTDTLEGKQKFIADKIVNRYGVNDYSNYGDSTRINIPITQNENVCIEMSYIAKRWSSKKFGWTASENRITVTVDARYNGRSYQKGKRSYIHSGKVSETSDFKFNLEKLFTFIDNRLKEKKEEARKSSIERKQKELNSMIMGGIAIQNFPELTDSRYFKKHPDEGSSGYIDASPVPESNGEQISVYLNHYYDANFIMSRENYIKLVKCLDEIGIMEHKTKKGEENEAHN